MTTSWKHDQDFISDVISDHMLEDAIEWIKSNLDPEDVFDSEPLDNWAADQGYVIPD